MKQLFEYFQQAPSPLGANPFPYNESTIRTLLEKLRPYDLTKAEVMMILNLRPTNRVNLSVIVQEIDNRFSGDELQSEIVNAIAEALGKPDGDAERQAMSEIAKEARKEQEFLAGSVEDMDVDGAS